MMSALPTKLWYQTLAVMQEDAPELMDQFIEESAAKMEVKWTVLVLFNKLQRGHRRPLRVVFRIRLVRILRIHILRPREAQLF